MYKHVYQSNVWLVNLVIMTLVATFQIKKVDAYKKFRQEIFHGIIWFENIKLSQTYLPVVMQEVQSRCVIYQNLIFTGLFTILIMIKGGFDPAVLQAQIDQRISAPK